MCLNIPELISCAAPLVAQTRVALCRCPGLFEIFADAQEEGDGSGKEVIVNFGEGEITQHQIDSTLLRDGAWAILSIVFAAIMLRIGTRSTFLTINGIVMILVRSQWP